MRLHVYLIFGVFSVQTDGIVNSCGSSLELGNAGMAAKAVRDAAGPGLQQECMKYVRQNGQVDIGKFALTAGHSLPSSYVYHGVIPTYDRNSAEKVNLLYSLEI